MNPVRTRRSRRASMLLFFLLVAMPVCWLAGALSVDYARTVGVAKKVSQTADAASLAAVAQLLPNDPEQPLAAANRIDSTLAESVALELIRDTENNSSGWDVRNVTVTVNQAAGGAPASVDVKIDYTVNELVFLVLAGNFNENLRSADGSTTKTAIICEESTAPTYDGICTRPRLNF